MPYFFTPMLSLMVITSIMTVILQRKHLLMALLAFEGMILSLVTSYIYMAPITDTFIIMILLTMGACEASLGLACMVNMSRSYGNDHLSSLTLSKC
nr:NADH dehydrogenase subunit 4L [Bhawania goodei]